MLVPRIRPCLWFDGQALEAAEFYCSVFPDSQVLEVSHYVEGAPFPAGTPLVVEVALDGVRVQLLNGGPQFTFSEAVSLSITCRSQDEVDHYWDALVAGGQESMCGWLKDRFGVSWQVVPDQLGDYLGGPDDAGRARATAAMMTMRKLDLGVLRAAYLGA